MYTLGANLCALEGHKSNWAATVRYRERITYVKSFDKNSLILYTKEARSGFEPKTIKRPQNSNALNHCRRHRVGHE
jgi:hypothetical protein